MAMQSIRAIFFAALGLLWAPISRASSFRPVAQNSASRAQAGVQEVHASAQQRNDFKAPEVVSASNVQYPLDTTADGIIVLEVIAGHQRRGNEYKLANRHSTFDERCGIIAADVEIHAVLQWAKD